MRRLSRDQLGRESMADQFVNEAGVGMHTSRHQWDFEVVHNSRCCFRSWVSLRSVRSSVPFFPTVSRLGFPKVSD